MKVIVPCCGLSTRFAGQPPKWTLPAYDGRPMLCHAVAGLKIDLDDLVVTILAEHEEQFRVTEGLGKAFGRSIRIVTLRERTRSQSETVAKTLEAISLDEPFLVKDSDGYFEINEELNKNDNYICVDSLNNFDSINPRNKSYLQIDQQGLVVNIREKVVISDLFNVGGYYFNNPRLFLEYYHRLSENKTAWSQEIYVSDVIGAMILSGVPFRAQHTTGYKDWGTIREWRQALLSQKTFFVMLDGFVLQRGSHYFRPQFNEVDPIPAAVECLKDLSSKGHRIVYLTIRPQEIEAETRKQMRTASVPEGPILWNCPIAKWIFLTAPHSTLPFLNGQAIELSPEAPNLLELVEGNVGPQQ